MAAAADAMDGLEDAGAQISPRMTFGFLVLTGYKVEVQLTSGFVYEGIFHATQFDHQQPSEGHGVILKYARVIRDPTVRADKDALAERPSKIKMFKASEMVQLVAKDVRMNPEDLSAAADEFETDAAISRGRGGEFGRELQRWMPDEGDEGGLLSLEAEAAGSTWNQFEVNERRYGVYSTYDEKLYTTVLDKDRCGISEAVAAKLAREIEQGNMGGATGLAAYHMLEERGMEIDDADLNEEDRYGAVVRDPRELLRAGQQPLQHGHSSHGGQLQAGSRSSTTSGASASGAGASGGGVPPPPPPRAWGGVGAGVAAVVAGKVPPPVTQTGFVPSAAAAAAGAPPPRPVPAVTALSSGLSKPGGLPSAIPTAAPTATAAKPVAVPGAGAPSAPQPIAGGREGAGASSWAAALGARAAGAGGAGGSSSGAVPIPVVDEEAYRRELKKVRQQLVMPVSRKVTGGVSDMMAHSRLPMPGSRSPLSSSPLVGDGHNLMALNLEAAPGPNSNTPAERAEYAKWKAREKRDKEVEEQQRRMQVLKQEAMSRQAASGHAIPPTAGIKPSAPSPIPGMAPPPVAAAAAPTPAAAAAPAAMPTAPAAADGKPAVTAAAPADVAAPAVGLTTRTSTSASGAAPAASAAAPATAAAAAEAAAPAPEKKKSSFSLNPNAKEFKLSISAKPFVPGGFSSTTTSTAGAAPLASASSGAVTASNSSMPVSGIASAASSVGGHMPPHVGPGSGPKPHGVPSHAGSHGGPGHASHANQGGYMGPHAIAMHHVPVGMAPHGSGMGQHGQPHGPGGEPHMGGPHGQQPHAGPHALSQGHGHPSSHMPPSAAGSGAADGMMGTMMHATGPGGVRMASLPNGAPMALPSGHPAGGPGAGGGHMEAGMGAPNAAPHALPVAMGAQALAAQGLGAGAANMGALPINAAAGGMQFMALQPYGPGVQVNPAAAGGQAMQLAAAQPGGMMGSGGHMVPAGAQAVMFAPAPGAHPQAGMPMRPGMPGGAGQPAAMLVPMMPGQPGMLPGANGQAVFNNGMFVAGLPGGHQGYMQVPMHGNPQAFAMQGVAAVPLPAGAPIPAPNQAHAAAMASGGMHVGSVGSQGGSDLHMGGHHSVRPHGPGGMKGGMGGRGGGRGGPRGAPPHGGMDGMGHMQAHMAHMAGVPPMVLTVQHEGGKPQHGQPPPPPHGHMENSHHHGSVGSNH